MRLLVCHAWPDQRAAYRRQFYTCTADGGLLIPFPIVSTKVPKELEGRGIGSRLVRGELKIAREQGLKMVPKCPFVKAYIDRHPEFADLLK